MGVAPDRDSVWSTQPGVLPPHRNVLEVPAIPGIVARVVADFHTLRCLLSGMEADAPMRELSC